LHGNRNFVVSCGGIWARSTNQVVALHLAWSTLPYTCHGLECRGERSSHRHIRQPSRPSVAPDLRNGLGGISPHLRVAVPRRLPHSSHRIRQTGDLAGGVRPMRQMSQDSSHEIRQTGDLAGDLRPMRRNCQHSSHHIRQKGKVVGVWARQARNPLLLRQGNCEDAYHGRSHVQTAARSDRTGKAHRNGARSRRGGSLSIPRDYRRRPAALAAGLSRQAEWAIWIM